MPRREYEAQFEDGTTEGTSFERRPDAVSRSYLQALAPGPRALNDPSEGLLVKGWYCRADNVAGKVYITPALDNVSLGWGTEVELFSFTGADIDEISLAFDQNGAPLIVAERAGNVWIRYFKPVAGDFVFEDFGVGTTPRVILDDPQNPTDSDLLVFYARAGELRIREQSDLYVSEISPGNALTADQYIEGVVRDGQYRVHVIVSTRATGPGTYSLDRISSALYPVYAVPEGVLARNRSVSGTVEVILIIYEADAESLDVANAAVSGTVQAVNWAEGILDEAQISSSVDAIELIVETILYEPDEESLDLSNASVSGTIVVAAIHYDNQPPESLDLANSSISGTIVVP